MASTINASNSGSGGLISTGDASGVLALQTANGTTAITVDTSQNVGIGTASPSALLEVYKSSTTNPNILYVTNPSTTGTFAAAGMALKSYNGTSVVEGLILTSIGNSWSYGNTLANSAQVYSGLTNGLALISENASGFVRVLTGSNASERMRINSSGRVLVAATTGQGDGKLYSKAVNGSYAALSLEGDATAGQYVATFYNANGFVGSIVTSGSSTAFNTSSDYRLKENIAPMTGALNRISALKPVTYKWKVDGSAGEGFIAHELAEIVAGCVSGEKDAVDAEGKPVYQGIDTSFLVATLTAAIQELKTINDTQAEELSRQAATINAQSAALAALTARVVALEGK